MPLLVQVKGYINEMAARLEDEDDRISSLAKLFFNELSKKGKLWYTTGKMYNNFEYITWSLPFNFFL